MFNQQVLSQHPIVTETPWHETILPCGAFCPVVLLINCHFVLNAASPGGTGDGMLSLSQLQLSCDCTICSHCDMFCSTWGKGDGNPLVTFSSQPFFQYLEQRWAARLRKGLCVCQETGCSISDFCSLKFAMMCLQDGDLSAKGFLGSPKTVSCAVSLSLLCHMWIVRKAMSKCSCCHA